MPARCAGTPSIRWRSISRAAVLAVIAAVLAFGLHRSLIEVVVVMAALGVAMQLRSALALAR